MGYEFEGVVYERLRDMQAVRRARYVEHLESGMNFTRAAHAVGVSKRTGKVWRNGRTRSTGRNESVFGQLGFRIVRWCRFLGLFGGKGVH